MFIKKLAKGLMMGVCISMLSTGVAKAEEVGVTQIPEVREELVEVKELEAEEALGQASGLEVPGIEIDKSLLQKQKEIDEYVYNYNAAKLKELGFEVTYTSPVNGYIEIGIIPYDESYADYLYEVFGKDSIQVVEGEKVMMYTMVSDNTADAPVSSEEGSVVGEDLILEEGEMGITSVETGSEVVDLDAQSKMAESGLVETTSKNNYDDIIAQTGVVDNAKTEKENNSMVLIVSIAGGAIIFSGAIVIGSKKKIFKKL